MRGAPPSSQPPLLGAGPLRTGPTLNCRSSGFFGAGTPFPQSTGLTAALSHTARQSARFVFQPSKAHPTRPTINNTAEDDSGVETAVIENEALKVGAGSPPTISVPTRNQSGSKGPFRTHA